MKSNNIIIDIGANHGDFSLEIAKRNPSMIVYAIEADPFLASELQLETSNRQILNHKIENFAISDTEGIADFFISELSDHGTSSLLKFSEKNITNDEYWSVRKDLQHTKKVSVHTQRLETFLDTIVFNEIEFIKIDIQGLDLIALKSAGHYLSKIKAGMLEMPAISEKSLYENSYDDLRVALNYLYENNFTVYGIKPNDEASNEFNIFFYRNGEDKNEIERKLNIRNFLYYDGKNFWHAPSYKLESPEQNIINLNFVLNEERNKNNILNKELNNIKSTFWFRVMLKLGLY